jgi:hypothetical protein
MHTYWLYRSGFMNIIIKSSQISHKLLEYNLSMMKNRLQCRKMLPTVKRERKNVALFKDGQQ